MFVDLFNYKPNSISNRLINSISKQEKLKLAITCLAGAILLMTTTYWICSRFWSSRRVSQEPRSDSHPQAKILKTEEAAQIGSSSPRTAAKVSICITSSFGSGLVGTQTRLIPHINKFKLENQNPIPFKKEDVLLPFHCSNLTLEMKFPESIYLPAILFDGKKEGDTLRLYYEDQIVEFHLHQNQSSQIYEEDLFEVVLQTAKQHGEDFNRPLFAKYVPYDWYHVNGGTLYKPHVIDNKELRLQVVSADQFRPLQKTAQIWNEKDREFKTTKIFGELSFDIMKNGEEVVLIADLSFFSSEEDANCIDIILNDDLLIFHVFREAKRYSNGVQRKPEEWLRNFEWKKLFPGLTIDQMKAKILEANLSLENGQLQFFFPANN